MSDEARTANTDIVIIIGSIVIVEIRSNTVSIWIFLLPDKVVRKSS